MGNETFYWDGLICTIAAWQTRTVRESSFNMTRGDEDVKGGLQKVLPTRKGGSEKIRGGSENLYTSKPTWGGGGS